MARYKGIDGVAREVIKRYKGVDGVARKISKGYRGIDGVARQYFSLMEIASAVIRLTDVSGETDSLHVTTNGYYHGSVDSSLSATFTLELYNNNGEQIEFETLNDIDGLDTFSLSVSTTFQIFAGSVTASDVIFGNSASSYESFSSASYKGSFTVTKDNFTSKYINITKRGSGQRTVTFGSLIINGEVIPLTFSEY